jgi:hypothetical protein
MELSPEVLIYVQTVMNYFNKNEEAHNYFIGESDEELFFKHLGEISEKNFKKNGEVALTKEQFEILRKTVTALGIATKDIPEETTEEHPHIFIDTRGFGKICLN